MLEANKKLCLIKSPDHVEGTLTNIYTLENQKSKRGIYLIYTVSSHLAYFSNITKPIP